MKKKKGWKQTDIVCPDCCFHKLYQHGGKFEKYWCRGCNSLFNRKAIEEYKKNKSIHWRR